MQTSPVSGCPFFLSYASVDCVLPIPPGKRTWFYIHGKCTTWNHYGQIR